MKKGIIQILLLVGLTGGYLQSFPPPNHKAFSNNSMRLLNTQQYSFLTQYFSKYYPRFKNNTNDKYVYDIVVRIPFTDKKETILKTYINNATQVRPSTYDLYGQIQFFNEDYPETIKAYLLYDQPEKFYYLGWSEKELGNLIDAREWFLKAVKQIKNKQLKESSYLGLADIYIRWKDFSKARKALLKVSNKSYHKSIMYYYLYKAEKNKKFLKRIIQKIRNFPSNDPLIKNFLKSEKLN